jgi:DNA transformation protein
MATSTEYADYVIDQLCTSGEIRHRKMFGDVGVYIDDVFCALISSKNIFYLRVVEPNNPGGKGTGMPYYEVPEDVLEQPEELMRWAVKAKSAALAAKKK